MRCLCGIDLKQRDGESNTNFKNRRFCTVKCFYKYGNHNKGVAYKTERKVIRKYIPLSRHSLINLNLILDVILDMNLKKK